MAAVDLLVLRRSSRIAQHPHHTTRRRPSPNNNPELLDTLEGDSSTSESDELTPRALRALKRRRLALDSDGLLLPHIETHHRRKRRKENDNATVGNTSHANIVGTVGAVKEVRRRMRQVRVRPRAQNVPKPRHIPPLVPTIIDLPIQPVTTQESLRDILTDQPSILAPKDDDSPPQPQIESHEPKSSSPLQVDLDSLIPLDPLPEFPPHDPPYTNSPDFSSNATFTSEFPPGTDMNPFSSNTLPFGSSQLSSPGPFGSNPFPSNPGSFSTGFSHEFIPTQSQPDFAPSQDNAFSNTGGNAFPTQEYTNAYTQSNGYPQQGTFSQPNSYEYTPAPHRDREVNIWKLACQERVEFLLRRYGIDTIKALVASEARARFPSPSTHPSNTRFRLYTPASYLERASYTYKSAEFEAIDFDMDDEEDEDEDLDECDLGGEYDDDYDDDEEDGDESLFLMDVEGGKGLILPPCVPTIVTPTVPSILTPTVPSILPPAPTTVASVPQKPPTSPPRSTSPPAVRSLLDTMPSPRPLCVSPPCSPPRQTPSPPLTPQRLSAPSTPVPLTPPSISTPAQTPPSIPPSNQMLSTSTHSSVPHVPSHPTPTPIHSPQTPSSPQTSPPVLQTPPQTPPQTHQITLPRTPPLSSLHVTLLSEPPRAFMGRGTPPDRRRLSEWGRWGCVQVYGGKGAERRRLSLGRHGHGEQVEQYRENMEQLHKEDMSQHHHVENPVVALQLENPSHHPQLPSHEHPHPTQQHEDPHHPHTHEHQDPPHTHTHTHSVPGEWTSFLFAMLEGDGTGSAGWYELEAQTAQGGEGMGVPQSMGVLGGTQMGSLGGAQSLGLGGAQSMGVLGSGGSGMGVPQGIGMGTLGASQTVGEADSTLRFALG